MNENDWMGIGCVHDARRGNLGLLIKRLRDRDVTLSQYERDYIAGLIDGSEKRMRGRPINYEMYKKIAPVLRCVMWLVMIEKWSDDAARQRASEIFGLSRTTVDNYISTGNKAKQKMPFYSEELDEKGGIITNIMYKPSDMDAILLGINAIISSDTEVIEGLLAEKDKHMIGMWRPYYVPDSTTSK